MNELIIKFYKLLKQEKRITDANYNKFSDILLEFTKHDLGVKNVSVSFFDGLKKQCGYSINDSISINKNRVSTKAFYKMINSIFHETRHIYQNENKINKRFNVPSTSNFRPIYFDVNSFLYINTNNMAINPFDLYIICLQEYDARKYASKKTNEFLHELKNLAVIDKANLFLSTLIDLQLYLEHKIDKREARKYNQSIKCIDKASNEIKTKAYYFIKDCLKELEMSNKNTISTNQIENNSIKKINLVLQFYYDDEIGKMLVNASKKYKNPYLLSSVVNCMLTSVSEKDLNSCVKMFVENNSGLKETENALCNWEESLVEDEFNKICLTISQDK